MFQFRFIIAALVFAFMAHPVGLVGANAYANVKHHELETFEQSAKIDAAHERANHSRSSADHSRSSETHDHHGGACCSTSGVCIAILVECIRTFDVVRVGSTDISVIRALTATMVDTLLQPPQVYS